MKQDITITNFEVLNNTLIVAFEKLDDIMVDLEKLRKNCPCASCQGETDVLGNVYRGPQPKYSELSFQINGIQPVGYYGIRPFWKDGHNTGIYTGTQLIELSKI